MLDGSCCFREKNVYSWLFLTFAERVYFYIIMLSEDKEKNVP